MNHTGIFLYSTWLATPLNTRHRIAEALHIKKVRSTHVVNDFVQDDGYNIQDVEAALSIANLQGYLNSDETDLNKLYQMTIDKAEGRETKEKIIDEMTNFAIDESVKSLAIKVSGVENIPSENIIIKPHAKAKKNKQK